MKCAPRTDAIWIDRTSRRAVLAGIGIVPLIGVTVPARPDATLQDVAGSNGRLFGTAVRASALANDTAYRNLVARQCGIVTPELELKWAWVEPRQGEMIFYDADRIAAFARATGKTMHGHALLWHQSIPEWARAALRDKPDWAIVTRFLASVIPRYKAIAPSWDVVNEPLEMGHRMDGLRPSPFLAAFGPDYVRRALEEARRLAPRARLFINEYDLDYDMPDQRDRRYLLLKLIERLRTARAPLDGIGIQAHLDLAKQDAFRPRVLADFLNDLGGLGMQVRISELDVKEANRRLPLAERDRRVGDAVAAYLDVTLANRAVGSVTCWGISNRYSWLGEDNRGLPFDAALSPTVTREVIATRLNKRA